MNTNLAKMNMRLSPIYMICFIPMKKTLLFTKSWPNQLAVQYWNWACGTGRVTIPLAREGYDIVGLDASKSMLFKLEEKLKKEAKDVRDRVTLVHGDMRNFDLGKKFKLIIIPFSSIVHIHNLDDLVDVFKCSHRHLFAGGILAFDIFNPNLRYLLEKTRYIFDIRKADEEKQLFLWETAKYDLTYQMIDIKRLVEVKNKTETKRYVWETKLRYYFWGELYLALKMAGFREINIYGNYDMSEFKYEKGKIVVIAKK
ncbi:MAG: class I SAM-dependent methyltransferase [Candidatus Njordarchaeia archaeon]